MDKKAFLPIIIPSSGGGHTITNHGVGLDVGYDYLAGLVPVPNVGLRFGNREGGASITGPIPGLGVDNGAEPRKWNANNMRNAYQVIADLKDKKRTAYINGEKLQPPRRIYDEFQQAIQNEDGRTALSKYLEMQHWQGKVNKEKAKRALIGKQVTKDLGYGAKSTFAGAGIGAGIGAGVGAGIGYLNGPSDLPAWVAPLMGAHGGALLGSVGGSLRHALLRNKEIKRRAIKAGVKRPDYGQEKLVPETE